MNLLKENATQVYGKLVSHLIRQRYDADSEIALINNYNLDPATYGEEYTAYQTYRQECKAEAKRQCEILES